MKSEWKTTDDPRWLLWLVLSTVLAGALFVLQTTPKHEPWWTALALLLAAAVNIAATTRSRLRLTDEGVEVRRLRTRTYRWSDIASIERAPEWESTSIIWLRLRGSVATSAPEVLTTPGTRDRATRDRALDHIVTVVRQRVASEQAARPSP
jgi:hypothetical protein